MGSQVSAKTNDKEQQLKKASKMAMVRALLPIVGLVVIFLLFNVLTDFRIMGNMSLAFSQVYVNDCSYGRILHYDDGRSWTFLRDLSLELLRMIVCILSKHGIAIAILGGIASGAMNGAINGFFYVYRKIKSFIVTICTMFLFRGFIKYMTTNAPVSGSATLINYDSTGFKVACTVVVLVIWIYQHSVIQSSEHI